MSFPIRTELVAENTTFETQQAVWKERLWGKSVLEENIRTVAFITGRNQRLFCVGILSNLPNDEQVEQYCDYLLDNYIDADSTFGPNVLHHHWGPQTLVSYSMPNSIHYFTVRNIKIRNETYVKIRSSLHDDLKKSSVFKQEDLISSKSGQYKVNLI